MTTPNGYPAWVRANGFDAYGGAVDKDNYESQGKVNAQTDVGAEEIMRLSADMAAVQRTADWCGATFVCDDTTTQTVTVGPINQMTGSRSATYAGATPPSGFPTVTRIADGHYRAVWATSYTDEYGVAGSVNIIGGDGSIVGSAGFVQVVPYDAGADGLYEGADVYVYDTAGVALKDKTLWLTFTTGPA